MSESLPDTDLVVATPERVSFDYQVAGLGTRAVAQLLDLVIVGVVLGTVLTVAITIGSFGSATAAILIGVIGSFLAIFGYFWLSEVLWSGQTVGKRVFRLRAVGDRGEPLTFMQAGIRNIVRIADFLPYGYGIGMVVLFANGRGKRLGDLAAGTIVVKDSDAVALWQLRGSAAPTPTSPPPLEPGRLPPPPPPPSQPSPPFALPPQAAALSPAELTLRRLDPDLRRLVSAYARRRPELSVELRATLAGQVQSSLRVAAPDVFTQYGPLAALDHLANLERQ